ncbi:MAG: hypothetical protein CME64_01880 [Halobacteriovoraceae bacterium]|nr:hypothetical protein [Halobacteriovoraceae bacterium]|tara:strand:- start:42608 stop:43066 length:459 start_codon:yes stop_codon:yes gene_type:complete
MNEILKKFNETFIKGNKFDRHMNMNFKIVDPGHIEYTMKIGEDHVSFGNVAHGGGISALMDATLGLAALSQTVPEGLLVSTVEFKMNFLRPAHVGDSLKGIGKVEHNGKSLIIANANIYLNDTDVLVAKGLGTFNKYPMEKKGLSNIYEKER